MVFYFINIYSKIKLTNMHKLNQQYNLKNINQNKGNQLNIHNYLLLY